MKYIFGSGTARGGTGILVQTLSAHSKVEYSLDPALGIYRNFRNALLKQNLSTEAAAAFDYSSPLSDYYFSTLQNNILNILLNGDLDLSIPSEEKTSIVENMKSRTALDNPDLVEHMVDNVKGSTYAELIESMIALIAKLRGSEDTEYCGMHENWTIEMFPALARNFPDAKFIVVLRDPRAVQASHLAVEEGLRTSLLSFSRGLRKLMNLSMCYLNSELFKGRLAIVTYEELLRKPESVSKSLCQFLGLQYESNMIDPDKHFTPGTMDLRDGVSSFEAQATGYNPERIDRWRKHLNGGALDLTEMVLDPDMRHFGYMPLTDWMNTSDSNYALQALHMDNQSKFLWRTDSPQSELEFGYELSRRNIIRGNVNFEHKDIINRCFLNDEVYNSVINYPLYEKQVVAKGGLWFS